MAFVENQFPEQETPRDILHGVAAERQSPEDQLLQSSKALALFTGIFSGLPPFGLIYLFFVQQQFQLLILVIVYGLCSFFCGFALRRLFPKNKIATGLFGIFFIFNLALLGTSVLLANLGFSVAVIALIYSLIFSSIVRKDWQANFATGLGIVTAGAAALLNDFSPFTLPVNLINVVTPAILGALFMVYVVMLAMQFITASLRSRLVAAFMAIVIIPLVILSAFQSLFMFEAVNNEVTQSLTLASRQTADSVEDFLNRSQNAVRDAAKLEIFANYLALPEDQRTGTPEEIEMQLTLRALDIRTSYSNVLLSSFALLDIHGNVMYDSLGDKIASGLTAEDISSVGAEAILEMLESGEINESSQDHFVIPIRTGKTYISPVRLVSGTQGYIFMTAPVLGHDDNPVGVVRARYDAGILQDLITGFNGLLGDQSYAMLLDENNIRLADSYMPQHLYRSVAPLSAEEIQSLQSTKRLPDLPAYQLSTDFNEFNRLLNNFETDPIFTTELGGDEAGNTGREIGAISNLEMMNWKVVYLQSDYSDEALRREQRQLTTLVTTLLAALAGIIAMLGAQLLSAPIVRLTRTAQSISQGDLEAKAPDSSTDEFGMLGASFNLMTRQLRVLIGELEDRVKTRTKEIEDQNEILAHRARQLQTVSDVARQIVSSQEIEPLLNSITQLISERFDFYHVGIFLLDEKKQNAVLRAANSEGGQRMLARHHTLPVGLVGIVGYVTGTGETRVATDVGEDAIYFNNPDLPNTRSEMALPLKVGDQIIGALDIQSTASNAFHADDIDLFETLADQVAVAIYNNQLYLETALALEEAQKLHRQYLQSEWIEETAHRKTLGYLYNQSGIVAQQAESPLWKKVFSSGEPVYANLPGGSESPVKAVMAVPIAVRGETIGVIHVQDQGEERMWSEDEVAVVNSIANQVAVALENARLFENTVRRAEREKKVLQITQKIRATNDPEEMMRIAISELQQALRASRTQIYIRKDAQPQDAPGHEENDSSQNSNGRKSKPSSG